MVLLLILCSSLYSLSWKMLNKNTYWKMHRPLAKSMPRRRVQIVVTATSLHVVPKLIPLIRLVRHTPTSLSDGGGGGVVVSQQDVGCCYRQIWVSTKKRIMNHVEQYIAKSFLAGLQSPPFPYSGPVISFPQMTFLKFEIVPLFWSLRSQLRSSGLSHARAS